MKKNFNQNIFNLDGMQMYDDQEQKKPSTMKTAICNALLFPNYVGEERLDGIEKVKRFNLAVKISKAESDIDVTAEELSMIKELIGKFHGPLVVGPITNYIEEKIPALKKGK